MQGGRLLALLLVSMMILAFSMVAHASANLGLTLVSTRNYTIPGILRVYCAASISSGRMLVAGSIGSPPKPYAAILTDAGLTPLTLPLPASIVKGEVTGCFWSSRGLILYGYVTDSNMTPRAVVWIYSNGALRYRVLEKIIIKPLDVVASPTATYIVGYIGACRDTGSLAIAYSILKPIYELLNGNYTGFVYAPGGIVKNRIIGRIGNTTFACEYFTGVEELVNSSVVLVGYGRTFEGIDLGFILLQNSLLNSKKPSSIVLLPMLPLATTHTTHKLVAVGEFIGGQRMLPGVLVVNDAGEFRIARLSVPGAQAAGLTSVSCTGVACIAGGSMLGGKGGSTPILAFFTLQGLHVSSARIYPLSGYGEGDVEAVLLNPDNTAYAVLVKRSGGESTLELLKLKVVQISSTKHVPANSVEAGGGMKEQKPISNVILVSILIAVGVGGLLLALYLHRAKR